MNVRIAVFTASDVIPSSVHVSVVSGRYPPPGTPATWVMQVIPEYPARGIIVNLPPLPIPTVTPSLLSPPHFSAEIPIPSLLARDLKNSIEGSIISALIRSNAAFRSFNSRSSLSDSVSRSDFFLPTSCPNASIFFSISLSSMFHLLPIHTTEVSQYQDRFYQRDAGSECRPVPQVVFRRPD